ncbi:hypothetical protein B4100_0697 [Heyndrickxia coagulans]|nr:hypothetical protein B4100_0697 [Heyndrickxia coagulans]
MGHKVKVPVQLTRVIATYWGRVIRRPKLKFLAKNVRCPEKAAK